MAVVRQSARMGVREWVFPAASRRAAETPRLARLWLALVGTLVVAAALGFGVYAGLVWLSGNDPFARTPLGSDAEQRKLLVEVVKVALGIAAAAGAVLALTVGYRRHCIEVSRSHRDDERLFTDRFESAAKLLGDEKAAVRLSGIYAMARLADDLGAAAPDVHRRPLRVRQDALHHGAGVG